MTTLPIERFASEQEAEKQEAEAEAAEAQAEADRQKADASRLKEGAGGLYGYTKGTQRDVEASIRKAQRRAASVAKALYAKDERSVDFLKAHAKRANSKSARLILAAMKNIGPRVASDKTAGSKLTPEQIDEIKGEMVKSGVPVRFMKGGGSLNIVTGQTTPRGANVMHQIVYWNFTKETAKKIADWLGARASFDKSAALLPSERHASIFHGSEKEQLEYVVEALRLAGNQGLRVDGLPRKGALAAQERGLADAERGRLYITSAGKRVRLASEEKIAGGLYGHPTKTARLALVACSDLRAYVGEVAYSLHSRRTAKYAKMTGFLKEHSKKSRCAYSRMILDCYPEAPVVKQAKSAADKKKVAPHMYVISKQGGHFMVTRGDPKRGGSKMVLRSDDDRDVRDWLDDNKRKISKDHMIDLTGKFDIPAEYSDFYMKMQGKKAADQMLKKAFVPDTVDGWLEWEDGTRTAASKTAMTPYEKNQKAMLAEAGDSLKRMYDPAKLAQAIVKMRSFKKMVGNSVDMVKDALIALEEGGAIRRLDDDLFSEMRDEAERLMSPRRRA